MFTDISPPAAQGKLLLSLQPQELLKPLPSQAGASPGFYLGTSTPRNTFQLSQLP